VPSPTPVDPWLVIGPVLITGAVGLIGAVITGIVSYRAARVAADAQIQVLERQLAATDERERRQRRLEVESGPLMEFRAELARMAQKHTRLISAIQLQYTRFGISDEMAAEILADAQRDWNAYHNTGDYDRARFQLADQEILTRAGELMVFMWQTGRRAGQTNIVQDELRQINADMAAIQKRINDRLAEL